MSSVFLRLMDRFFAKNDGYNVTISGPGDTGKTTLLYLLKLGYIIQTISTHGTNIETIKTSTATGRTLKFTGWDVGAGCANIRTMTRIYSIYGDAMIWVVDSTDRGGLSEDVQALTSILGDIDASRSKSATPRKNYCILILANKQDLPGAMPIDDIRRAYATALSGRTASIFKTSLTQNTGLPDAFEWFLFALQNSSAGNVTQSLTTQTTLDPRSPTALEEKFNSWLGRVENDSDPQEFIAQFHSLSLPAWDHYTHIRIAFVLLSTYGRQKGKDMIFEGIEKYIAQSPQTRGRTFHVTMTYFWVQIVHLGIRNLNIATLTPSNSSYSLASSDVLPDQFPAFLLLNPYVADGNLWADYYSKEVMMSPVAKAGMVLPDRKSLPNLVIRDAIQKGQ